MFIIHIKNEKLTKNVDFIDENEHNMFIVNVFIKRRIV